MVCNVSVPKICQQVNFKIEIISFSFHEVRLTFFKLWLQFFDSNKQYLGVVQETVC